MAVSDFADLSTIGRFTLHHRLGEGGMGEVHFGESPAGQLAAIKVIKDAIEGQEARESVSGRAATAGLWCSPSGCIADSSPILRKSGLSPRR